MSKFVIDHPLVVISTFVWIGFVCSISFMEAWLKFRAPGISVPLGLGIGRLVFKALNLVEWILGITVVVTLLLSRDLSGNPGSLYLLAPLLILVIQTWYALPELSARAEMHMKGWIVPPSKLHFYYVAMEAVKVICLIIYGALQFK